jgi:hypothetical protein
VLREPSTISEQLPIPLDKQEPIPISSGEVKLWVHDDPHAPPAMGSNPISAGHTRLSSPSSPDSPATPVYRRITSGGRYKVPLPSPTEDSTTPIQSISHTPAPSRECSLGHPLLSLFSLTLLPVTSDLSIGPSPTIEAATLEEYSLGDATPPGGYYVSHIPFTPSTPGG